MQCDKLELWKTQGRYVLEQRKAYPYALAGLVALVFINLLVGGKLLTADNSWWKDFLEPIVGLGTLFTAVAVWLGETAQDWRGSLPKRLTVDFQHKGRLVMRCENACLAGEGDIRALGQQIGAQMAGENLKLKIPTVQTRAGAVEKDDQGDYWLSYQANFELTALPAKLQQELADGHYLIWRSPFDKVDHASL